MYLDRVENYKHFRRPRTLRIRVFDYQLQPTDDPLLSRGGGGLISRLWNSARRIRESRDGDGGFSLSCEYKPRGEEYLIGARYKISSPQRSYVSAVNVRTQIRRCNIRRSKRQCMVDRAAIMWVSGVARLSLPLSLSLSFARARCGHRDTKRFIVIYIYICMYIHMLS